MVGDFLSVPYFPFVCTIFRCFTFVLVSLIFLFCLSSFPPFYFFVPPLLLSSFVPFLFMFLPSIPHPLFLSSLHSSLFASFFRPPFFSSSFRLSFPVFFYVSSQFLCVSCFPISTRLVFLFKHPSSIRRRVQVVRLPLLNSTIF